MLCHKFTKFMTMRAEDFVVLRRQPVEGYDVSFLITNFHTEAMYKHKLVDFVITFMEEIDREISEMRLAINSRARQCAKEFLKSFFLISFTRALVPASPVASGSMPPASTPGSSSSSSSSSSESAVPARYLRPRLLGAGVSGGAALSISVTIKLQEIGVFHSAQAGDLLLLPDIVVGKAGQSRGGQLAYRPILRVQTAQRPNVGELRARIEILCRLLVAHDNGRRGQSRLHLDGLVAGVHHQGDEEFQTASFNNSCLRNSQSLRDWAFSQHRQSISSDESLNANHGCHGPALNGVGASQAPNCQGADRLILLRSGALQMRQQRALRVGVAVNQGSEAVDGGLLKVLRFGPAEEDNAGAGARLYQTALVVCDAL
uniref:Actin-related protein 2/3 complex subunit 4 n=1 Tax=Macrostomum lignano TaxID=282301 RepID=A0A1I8HZ58_9PLAT